MKKILLATSALAMMSGAAVAGDIPVAMAPMVSGWTVTASGEIMAMGWFTSAGSTFGVNLAYEGEVKVAKTLDNAASVFVKINAASPNALTAVVGYSDGIGTYAAGIQARTDHDVEIPTAPGVPDLEDPTTFADGALYVAPAFNANWAAGSYAVTFASEKIGGFQVGLGVDGGQGVNVVLAGSFDISGATVSVGASYDTVLPAVAAAPATVAGGLTIAVAGFTIGADSSYVLGAAINSAAVNAGVGYTIGSFTLGANYAATVGTIATGVASAGVAYAEGDLKVGANGSYNLATNAIGANAGGTYQFGDFLVGAGGTYTTVANVVTAHAGVDYALNSNVTIGAGGTFTTVGNAVGVGAGIKITFP